jgi:hypothetical protein
MPKTKYYLAYGSNLNLKQMAERCPKTKPLGAVTIEGYRLLFRGGADHAVATIEPCEGSVVHAGLWQLYPEDEWALDRYEGFPRFYYKKTVNVLYNGKSVPAMVYIMSDGYPPGLPSLYYLKSIQDGYKDFGLNASALNAALKASKEAVAHYNLPE